MKRIKKLLIFFTVLTLIGCKVNIPSNKDDITSNLTKEMLLSDNRYSINSCYDEIVEYRFYEKTYNKIFYKDETFKDIEKEIIDKIEYKDYLNITLYEGELVIDCGVQEKSNKAIVLYCINREYKDNNNSYHTKRTLYLTKEEAIEHSDEDCDF